MRYEQALFTVTIQTSRNMADVCRKLGITATVANYKTIKKYIDLYKLSTEHFSGTNGPRGSSGRFKDSEVFVKDSTFPQHCLKARVIKRKLIPYKCQCGLTDLWNGSKLVLQLDHINGVNNDNRLKNLRFMCPNCHSQTDTYTAKNKRMR